MNQKNFSLPQYLQLAQYYPEAFAAETCAVLIFFSWFCLQINWVGLALLILATAYVNSFSNIKWFTFTKMIII